MLQGNMLLRNKFMRSRSILTTIRSILHRFQLSKQVRVIVVVEVYNGHVGIKFKKTQNENYLKKRAKQARGDPRPLVVCSRCFPVVSFSDAF